MTDPATLIDRIQYIQAELASLAALVRLIQYDAPTSATVVTPAAPEAAPAPAPVAERPVRPAVIEVATPTPSAPVAPARAKAEAPSKPARRKKAPAAFSYVPTASYRIVGPNPFRNGNNLALFDHLQSVYADRPFSRVQLGEEIARLQSRQVMSSRQPEQAIVIGFLKFAGIEKGRIVMASSGEPAAAAPAPAEPKRELKTKRRPRAADAS